MDIKFKPLGVTEERMTELLKMSLKYDKRQKKQMLAAVNAPKPTLSDVETFEKRTKHILPESYQNFLLSENGGAPSKSHIVVPDIGTKVVQRFYALNNPARMHTIEHVMEVYQDRLPTEMLPIADGPSANLFLLNSIPGSDYGKIYFWDHNLEADTEPQPYFGNLFFVSASFAEFVQSLIEIAHIAQTAKGAKHHGNLSLG